MGTDSTGSVLTRLSLPAMSSLLIHATYNVVDSLFVGRYIGTPGLAAVGLNFPFFIFSHWHWRSGWRRVRGDHFAPPRGR